MQAKFQSSPVPSKDTIALPMLGQYRGSLCFECFQRFTSEAQGALHAQTLGHDAVLALFDHSIN